MIGVSRRDRGGAFSVGCEFIGAHGFGVLSMEVERNGGHRGSFHLRFGRLAAEECATGTGHIAGKAISVPTSNQGVEPFSNLEI